MTRLLTASIDWVSEFAPPSCQKSLSYFTGWMSMLSWQAGTASGPYLVGTLIQSMIYERDNSYGFSNWQGTMFVWAISIVVFACNVWGGRAMPVFQNLMLILHVFGFLTVRVHTSCDGRDLADYVVDRCHDLHPRTPESNTCGLLPLHQRRRLEQHGFVAHGRPNLCNLRLHLLGFGSSHGQYSLIILCTHIC